MLAKPPYLRAVPETGLQRRKREKEEWVAREFNLMWKGTRTHSLRFPREELPRLVLGQIAEFPTACTMRVRNAVFDLGPSRYHIRLVADKVCVMRVK